MVIAPSRTMLTTVRAIVGVTFVLLMWSGWRFRESLTSGGLPTFLGAVGALVVYWVLSEWLRRASTGLLRTAMISGAKIGVVVGILAIINHVIEVFSWLRPPAPAILGVTMWGLMFLAFGGASSITYSRTLSMGSALFASVWSALISSAATVLFAVSAGLVFTARMENILAAEFARSGMRQPQAFVVRHLFEGALTHLVAAPLLAVVVGAASLVACALLKGVPRRRLAILGSLDLLLLSGGVFAIHFASSLERSARPPFIMAGLLGLCLSLASASALIASIGINRIQARA